MDVIERLGPMSSYSGDGAREEEDRTLCCRRFIIKAVELFLIQGARPREFDHKTGPVFEQKHPRPARTFQRRSLVSIRYRSSSGDSLPTGRYDAGPP